MNKLTYRQAYDKIIEAYFKDEVEPFDAQFCFCGTLCGNDGWLEDKESFVTVQHHYTRVEYGRMETALLIPFLTIGADRCGKDLGEWIELAEVKDNSQYESILFAGMCAALEVLKQIHRERGEDVDEVPVFNKRELKTV